MVSDALLDHGRRPDRAEVRNRIFYGSCLAEARVDETPPKMKIFTIKNEN